MANNAETPARRRALLLTRPRQMSDGFLASLDQAALRDVTVCQSPLIEIAPVPHEAQPGDYDAVIFTSAHGVAQVPEGAGQPAYCVGERTGAAAQAQGWHVLAVAEDAQGLITLIRARRRPGRLLHLAGRHRRGDIVRHLRDAAISADAVTTYDQLLRPLSAEAQQLLAGNAQVIVPLFSPRTARQFAQEARASHSASVLAMSRAVAEALGDLPLEVLHIAAAPTADSMRKDVEMMLRGFSLA